MTFSRLLLVAFLLVSAMALAEQNVPVNVPGGGAQDLLNITTPMDGQVENTGVRFTCTDSYGRPSHRGEPYFDDCMKQKRGSTGPKASPSPTSVKN
jgi:hypothetical protein